MGVCVTKGVGTRPDRWGEDGSLREGEEIVPFLPPWGMEPPRVECPIAAIAVILRTQ